MATEDGDSVVALQVACCTCLGHSMPAVGLPWHRKSVPGPGSPLMVSDRKPKGFRYFSYKSDHQSNSSHTEASKIKLMCCSRGPAHVNNGWTCPSQQRKAFIPISDFHFSVCASISVNRIIVFCFCQCCGHLSELGCRHSVPFFFRAVWHFTLWRYCCLLCSLATLVVPIHLLLQMWYCEYLCMISTLLHFLLLNSWK